MALIQMNLDEAFSAEVYDTLPDPAEDTQTGYSMRILSPAPGLKLLGIIANPLNAQVLEQLHGDNAGSFQVPYAEVALQPDLYNYGNVVQVLIDGDVRAAWIIRNKHRVLIANGEEGARYYEVSGPGLRDWFNAAIVYPENPKAIPLGKLKSHARYFNFGTFIKGPWYVPSQWTAPGWSMNQLNMDDWHNGDSKGNPWRYAPIGIPDTTDAKRPNGASWIWPSDPTPSAPVGACYFRHDFTVDKTGTYELYATGDNTIQAFVDGVPLINQHNTGRDATWRHIYSNTIDLNAGNHVLALRVENYQDGGNPAGALAILYRNGDAKKSIPATIVCETGDSGWKVLAYPSHAPGWSPGEVLTQLLNEAKARKVHSIMALKPSFTKTHDSNGDPWEYHIDYSFDVGTSYYDVVNTLESLSCDVWIDPKTFKFHVYNKQGTDRTVQTATKQPVIFARGLNAIESNEDSINDIVNTFLVGYGNEKLMEVVDPFSTISKYGRRERWNSVDANLDKSAADSITHYMAEASHLPTDSVTITISQYELNTPWKDFRIGDWVLAPHTGGAYKKRRVISITGIMDRSTGRVTYELELDSLTQDRQEAIARYMQRHVGIALNGTAMTAGSSGGGSSGGTGSGGSSTTSSGDGSTLGYEVPSAGSSGSAVVAVSSSPPANPPVGQLWFNPGAVYVL